MHGCKDIPLIRSIFSLDERSPYKGVSLYKMNKTWYCCRGVNCQLLPSDDPAVRRNFVLTTGIPTAAKDETRCDLRVRESLDYETRASYVLQVVAEVSCFHMSESFCLRFM